MKVKEESEKVGLKLSIQKMRIMASNPITSWQINGETMEGNCSPKMIAPWKKSYDQPRQRIKEQKHYFANKGPSSQSYGVSGSHVWM